MQYQVFVQSRSEENFIASVIGMPNISIEGKTEAEAILKAKSALESQLATGKFVNIEINLPKPDESTHKMKYSGIFADDPSFDDLLEKLTAIRQELNSEVNNSIME
jgi:predicted RNase H-like HicB family nuclease